jgi:tRNA G18 (ribose-2'-O)-methylase SpoU
MHFTIFVMLIKDSHTEMRQNKMRKLQNEELKRKSVKDFKEAIKLPFVIVLDNVRSLNNIGSIFRTSDAFLAEGIYLCGITATPPHREIHKTALGSTQSVAWSYYEDTLDAITALKTRGYEIVSLEQTESSIALGQYAYNPEKKYALVFGNEAKGVSQAVIDACDQSIEIPQFGTKHSFNISVSVGIVLWDFYNNHSKHFVSPGSKIDRSQ